MRGLSSCPRPTSVPLTPPMTCTPNLQPLPGPCSNSSPLFFFPPSSPFCQQVRREIHFHSKKQKPPNLCPPSLMQFDASAYNPNFLKSLSLLSCFYFLIFHSFTFQHSLIYFPFLCLSNGSFRQPKVGFTQPQILPALFWLNVYYLGSSSVPERDRGGTGPSLTGSHSKCLGLDTPQPPALSTPFLISAFVPTVFSPWHHSVQTPKFTNVSHGA